MNVSATTLSLAPARLSAWRWLTAGLLLVAVAPVLAQELEPPSRLRHVFTN